MPPADDQEQLLSGGNDQEAFLNDEKQWSPAGLETGTGQQRKRFTTAFVSYRWVIDAFLLVVITGLLLLLWDQSKGPPKSLQVGGDSTGAGPNSSSSVNVCPGVLTHHSPNPSGEIRIRHVVHSSKYVRFLHGRDT